MGKDKPKPEPAETKESSEKPSRNRQNRQLTSPDNEESEEGQDLADKSEETTTEGEDLKTSAEGEDATPTTTTEGKTQATPRPGRKRRKNGRKMKRKCMRGKWKRRRGGFATTQETIILQVSGREKGRKGGNQKKGGRVKKCAMGLGKRGKRFRRPYPKNKYTTKAAPKTTTESTTKPSMFRSFRKLKSTTEEPKGIMEKRMSALSAFTEDTDSPE